MKTMTMFLLLTLAVTSTLTAPADVSSSELEVLAGNTQFSQALYNAISPDKKDENIFFSPISAHAVLSMVYQGAAGTTKEAFTNTLHVANPEQAAEGYDSIIQNLSDVPNITLAIANKVYVKEGIPLKKPFEEVVTQKFHSEVQNIDFGKNVEAAQEINSWVKDKTHEKIPKLFEPDDLSEDTRVVLVNAIYFKGNWAEKFDKQRTTTEPFYYDGENDMDCQMMHISKHFNFKHDKDLKAKVLEMKYQNEDYSMILILPDDKKGIADLEAKLANKDLNQITEGMYSTEVDVSIPKFKIEESINLNDILTKMGLGIIFDDTKCDLSEMIDNDEKLVVSKAIQKAFIEVNEEGAEAAAATGAVIEELSLHINQRFYANRPFIFLLSITDGEANNILFYGKVSHPKYGDDNIGPRVDVLM